MAIAMMFGLIDVMEAGSTSSIPVKLMTLILLFISTVFLTVSYPPSYLKKKYEDYQMAKKVLQGEDHRNLSLLELVARIVKAAEGIPIVKGEDFMQSNIDTAHHMFKTDDEDYCKKYWPFAPGLTFEQNKDGLHVKVVGDDHWCKMMSSLSYWSFHANDEVLDYAIQKARETGCGNHGSYLLLGKNTVVQEAYDRLCQFFNRKYCAISASGFLACMNIVSNLVPKGGVIFMDEKAHICLRFGGKISGAQTYRFPHNNYDALEEMMRKNRHRYAGRAILVLDGIYSADGTIANLPRARELCDKYNVALVMDEAHSLGSMGITGRGIEEFYNMPGSCDFICGVFSKSLSSYGGFVVSNHQDVATLTISPGVGFATGPHAFSAATVSKGLEIIMREGAVMRPKMEALREHYVEQLYNHGCKNILHVGHDIFVSFPHTFAATVVSVEMRKKGFLISSFMYPSVPLGRSILRITIHPLITHEIIKDFCEAIEEVCDQLAVSHFDEHIMHGEHEKPLYFNQEQTMYVPPEKRGLVQKERLAVTASS